MSQLTTVTQETLLVATLDMASSPPALYVVTAIHIETQDANDCMTTHDHAEPDRGVQPA